MSMRPFDSARMLDDARTMTAGFAVGTATSTNSVDMGVADADETGDPQIAVWIEGPTSAGGNTGTIQVVLQDSADNSSFATILTGKVSAANATDINPYRFNVPPKHRRYLRTQYVVAAQNFTAGTLHAGVV